MSASLPQLAPKKPPGVRVMSAQLPADGRYSRYWKVNGGLAEQNAKGEVEILNHCFDDVERFMSRLQQVAEAQGVLNQRKKKRSRNSKKKNQEEDLVSMKACPPPEEEFVDIFQKIKYSLSLLDRLKACIVEPGSPELLHHVFIPLGLMVKTTGGPALGASVVSPALTRGAVSLLLQHLSPEEKALWTSLGPNWTLRCSQLGVLVPPYSPVFLDGWRSLAVDWQGKPLEDPIESQHKQDSLRDRVSYAMEGAFGQPSIEIDSSKLPPEGERHFCCSYDFVARNSSELSVLQGETLEVVESSKRWWKCRNRFDQIGFVPFNILEPLSALNKTGGHSPLKSPLSPGSNKYFSFAPASPTGGGPIATSPTGRPLSMPPMQEGDAGKVLMMNDELLQRLAKGRPGSVRPLVIPRAADTAAPLDYHSPPAQVEAWLLGKGFSRQTIQSLGILTGAQLFSLNKEELRTVSPGEGARVYSQVMVQKALLEDVHKTTELEKVMAKQKEKVDLKSMGSVV